EAVRRYLHSAVRDPHAAEELAQEFALALVRGDFRHADPGRGRFRQYVKGVLFHLISSHHKAQARQPRALTPENVPSETPSGDGEEDFDESWRGVLLARTWGALADAQPTFHAVLRFRAEHPKVPSEEMAEHLSRQLGRPLTRDWVRQTLRRAREKFADLL